MPIVRIKRGTKKGMKKKKKVVLRVKPILKKKKILKSKIGLTPGRARSAPVAKALTLRQNGPRVNNGKSFVVKNRELLMSVTSNDLPWDTYSFACQPGVDLVFPWLSLVAVGFREYRFRKLIFHYEPNTSTNITGAIVMLPLYNADDSAPFSVQQALDYKGAISIPAWERGSMNMKDQKFTKNLFVRSGPLSSGSSYLLYDMGTFCFALDGVPSTANIGKLFVDYEVEFFIPVRNSGISAGYSITIEPGNNSHVSAANIFTVSQVSAVFRPIVPPTPKNDDFFKIGGMPGYSFAAPNTVAFYSPGLYTIEISMLIDTVAPVVQHLAGTVTSGLSVLSNNFTFVAVPIDTNDYIVQHTLVQVHEENAEIAFIYSDPTSFFIDVRCSIYTVNNAVILDAPLYLKGSVITNEHTKKIAIKQKVDPAYFNSSNVRVLKDVDFKSFKTTGILPKRTKEAVHDSIKDLQLQLSRLVIETKTIVDSEDDMEEVELKSSTPQSGSIKTPVVRTASPNVDSFGLGQLFSRKVKKSSEK